MLYLAKCIKNEDDGQRDPFEAKESATYDLLVPGNSEEDAIESVELSGFEVKAIISQEEMEEYVGDHYSIAILSTI